MSIPVRVPPPRTSAFLTLWFFLDALLNLGCGTLFLWDPNVFWRTEGGAAAGSTPEVVFALRTLASYFWLASVTMFCAARTRDVRVRRMLMFAYILAGLVHIGSCVATGGVAENKEVVVADVVVIMPYIWYGFMSKEGAPRIAHIARSSE